MTDVTEKQLLEIQKKLSSLECKKDAIKLVRYELAPLLQKNKKLQKEFARRSNYYAELAKTTRYKRLYGDVIKLLKQLGASIDTAKLSATKYYLLPKARSITPKEWDEGKDDGTHVDAPRFVKMLSKKSTWVNLDGGQRAMNLDEQGVVDSLKTPWRPTLEQFQNALSVVKYARRAGANNGDANEEIKRLQELIEELDQLLQSPWYELHIADFEVVDLCLQKSPLALDVDTLTASTIQVCSDLALFLSVEEERDTKRTGRPPELKYESPNILVGKKSCKLSTNSYMASLCEIVLTHRNKEATWSWEDLYERLYGTEHRSMDEWRKIDSIVRKINDKAAEDGIEPILSYNGGSSGHVQRLF